MHKGIQFPIDCRYKQKVYRRYAWGGGSLRTASDECSLYDAFDNPDLISSLVRLVERTSEGGRKAAMKRWVEAHGFLTSSARGGASTEKLEDFWTGAESFVRQWGMYGFIRNRRLGELKKLVRFAELDMLDLGFHPGANAKTVFADCEKDGFIVQTTSDTFYKATLKEIDRDPLPYYQVAVFVRVRKSIEYQLEGIALQSHEWSIIKEPDRDHYRIVPHLLTKNLLQALYLQFYILLNDTTKKVCDACGSIFAPSRRDQKYCSDTCKNTAKSRRWRSRKRQKAKSRQPAKKE